MSKSVIFFVVPALALALACGNAKAPGTEQVNSAAVSSATNRQKALGPDKGTGHGDDSLFWPSDFEAAAAARPEQQSLVFFSRCRRAPFTSTSFYAPFDSANADAIVNDELFPLVDGT